MCFQDTENVTRCQVTKETRPLGRRKRRLREKATYARGTQCRAAVLSEDDVREIRKRLRNGESTHRIARDYGISAQSILNIKHGKSWSHVQ